MALTEAVCAVSFVRQRLLLADQIIAVLSLLPEANSRCPGDHYNHRHNSASDPTSQLWVNSCA